MKETKSNLVVTITGVSSLDKDWIAKKLRNSLLMAGIPKVDIRGKSDGKMSDGVIEDESATVVIG